jgi:hypothetical protein
VRLVGARRRLAMGVPLGGPPPRRQTLGSGAWRGGCPSSDPGCGPWAAEDGLCGLLASGYNYHLASGGSRDGGPLRGRLPNRPSTRGGSGPRPAAQPLERAPVPPWGTWTGEAEARRDRRPAPAAGGLPGRSVSNNLSGRLTAPVGPAQRAPHDSYLVDSASSHMLVSKIKPCMSKYKQLYRETANGSLYKLSFI